MLSGVVLIQHPPSRHLTSSQLQNVPVSIGVQQLASRYQILSLALALCIAVKFSLSFPLLSVCRSPPKLRPRSCQNLHESHVCSHTRARHLPCPKATAKCHSCKNSSAHRPNLSPTVAEKTYLRLRSAAASHPSINFVAVSHSDQPSTDHWLSAIGGDTPSNLSVVVDDERKLYAAWGLGVSSFWHVLSPGGLYAVYRLGKEEGIWNRPTESGSRWQTSGSFAVDGKGIVRWGGPSARADEIPAFEDAVKATDGTD